MLADARAGKFEVILAKTQSRFTRDMELVEKYLHGLFRNGACGSSRCWTMWIPATLQAKRHARSTDLSMSGTWRICPGMCGLCWTTSGAAGATLRVLRSTATGRTRKITAVCSRTNPPRRSCGRYLRCTCRETARAGSPGPSTRRACRRRPPTARSVLAGRGPTPASLWCKATVRRILSTQTYAGDLEQGRVRKLNYKSRRVIRLPREDWIIVPGTHVPLISRADFAADAGAADGAWRTDSGSAPPAGLGLSGVVSAEARWS